MRRIDMIARGFGLSAMLVLATGPALAEGKADRARAAIATAMGKVDAADKLGATGEVPRMQAAAHAALATAQEDLKRGHKERAFDGATRASQLADTAIGESQKNRAEADAARRADANAAVQANAAAAADARDDAAAANARADAAQAAAAASAADAAAARATPPVVVAAAAPTTTVTVEKTAQVATTTRRAPVKKTTTVRPTTSRPVVTEKTTVTTTPN